MDNGVIDALVEVARRWQEPSHPPRERAVEETLNRENRFTEEAVAFAINHMMRQLTRSNLVRWRGERTARSSYRVGALHGGRVPLEGFRGLLAVLLTGHVYVGYFPDQTSTVIPAFAEELMDERSETAIGFADSADDVGEAASAMVVSGDSDILAWARELCEANGISRQRRLIRTAQYAVAVIDGQEDEEERSGLAEDMLLYDGEGACNVSLLWAPEDQNPDPYLEMMAQFREIFPPHEDTDGALAMPLAFLEARDQGHAYGLGFLVSRGEPEVKRPAHIRWTEFESTETVESYLSEYREEISLVVAEPRVGRQLDTDLPIVDPGDAHRRPLDWVSKPPNTVDWLLDL